MPDKKCFKCKKTKPIELFYVHPQMADGRLGKCIMCCKKDVSTRYYSPTHRNKILRYERKRNQDPERKQRRIQYQKNSRANQPGKWRCRNWVSNALRDKRLKRMPCEMCGSKKSEAHHDDYRKPQQVRWLCFRHHREVEHGQIITALKD